MSKILRHWHCSLQILLLQRACGSAPGRGAAKTMHHWQGLGPSITTSAPSKFVCLWKTDILPLSFAPLLLPPEQSSPWSPKGTSCHGITDLCFWELLTWSTFLNSIDWSTFNADAAKHDFRKKSSYLFLSTNTALWILLPLIFFYGKFSTDQYSMCFFVRKRVIGWMIYKRSFCWPYLSPILSPLNKFCLPT